MLNPKYVTVITDDLLWADLANITYLQRKAIDISQELHSGVIRKKESRQLKRNVIKNSGELIKRRAIKDQKTTTKQCTITITQQYHWHQMTDSLYSFFLKENEGLCMNTGKSFEWVMDSFIFGGEKTYIMDNAIVDLRVIENMDVKKHVNNVDNRRGYITL